MIFLKRVYDAASPKDRQRILVERLWPRGISKEKAQIDVWLRDIAPSTELRKWYNHELSKWEEFKQRYTEELKANNAAVEQLKQLVNKGTVTFIFAAKDIEHNSAVLLKEFLQ